MDEPPSAAVGKYLEHQAQNVRSSFGWAVGSGHNLPKR